MASLLAAACEPGAEGEDEERSLAYAEETEAAEVAAREDMVTDQLVARGIRDPQVLAAVRKVPRESFVPKHARAYAYEDSPLPIGFDQTISQPYIVALMTSLLDLEASDRVLEIGTGSGYQAAVLAELARQVYSIEIVEPLAKQARDRLARLKYDNVVVRAGDGYAGWPEHAPFDGIIVTAAPPTIPERLKDQLAMGGRLVVPVGKGTQELRVLTRTSEGFTDRSVLPVMFVPMTGRAQESSD